ncbi:MAG: DUF3301 domain-containing protein [Gammaproteobacteria bacterium]|nr:DUF3301 domain-containing protein [Gammaproteobacteria bacterium]
MTFYPLFMLAIISLIVLLWYESMRFREFVIAICRKKCREYDLQLLDQTVTLSKISLTGNLLNGVTREYRFEVSSNGTDRLKGYIQIQGRYLVSLQIENTDGLTIIYPERPVMLN